MQKRSFLLLAGATTVLVAAALYALAIGDRAVRPVTRDQRAFPELAARLDDLAWMRLTRGALKVDLNLVAGRWAVIERGNYPAAPDTVRRLLLGLAGLVLVEPKTERPELFGRLDLDDPSNGRSTLVELQDRTGKILAELVVGKTSRGRLGGGDDAVYVRRPGENRTWLGRGSLDLPADVAGWLDRRILDIPASRIASVRLRGGDGTVLVLQREAAGGKFAVADAPADANFKDDAALAAPARALAGLDLADVRPSAELPVPANGVATASFTTFDGLRVDARLLAHGNADWVALDASGSGAAEADAAALGTRLARWTYAIPAERARLLRTRLADLVEPKKG
ncbi:MAG TPA: DUF4340 domain-containing protein [Stellaceae bacterium]|jgi:hypothetical protein|nr:DUF4340 domain-containing protein [Stellaceae bacterium]